MIQDVTKEWENGTRPMTFTCHDDKDIFTLEPIETAVRNNHVMVSIMSNGDMSCYKAGGLVAHVAAQLELGNHPTDPDLIPRW